jgi:diguanylate cyclase (GGDEF)-like protein/PAS domain S-box-containing protein
MSASIFRLMPSMVRSSTRSMAPRIPDWPIILLLLAAIAGLFYQYRVHTLEMNFERMATNILERASQSLRAELDTITGDALLLASHPDRTPSAVERRLVTLLQVRPGYRHAIFVDNDAELLAHAVRTDTQIDLDLAPTLPSALQVRALALGPGQLYVAEPRRQIRNGVPAGALIHLAAPVFDAGLQRYGAIILAYETAALATSLRTAAEGIRFEILDGTGEPLDARSGAASTRTDEGWSESIPLLPSSTDQPRHLTLRVSLADGMVAEARREEFAFALALWLALSIPSMGLVYVARRARERERPHQVALAENTERLVAADPLASLDHWRWEQQLRSLTAEREMILNRIPAFVLHKDCDGYVVHANRMSSVYARKPLDQIVGRHGSEVFPNSDVERIRNVDAEVIRTGEPVLGILDSVVLEDGTTQWFEIDVFPDLDASGKVAGIVVFGLDVTQRKRAEEQVAYLAMHDPLTDLCNRRLLADRLSQALAHCSRHERCCSLLFVDLDLFKRVNDEHGHDIGDLLLVQASQRLRGCMRSEDTVARIGGDEFVILLPEISAPEDSVIIAEKVRAAIGQPFELHGVRVEIGCSIGVANYPDHGRNERELMIAADAAMYAVKDAGRNAVRLARAEALPAFHATA